MQANLLSARPIETTEGEREKKRKIVRDTKFMHACMAWLLLPKERIESTWVNASGM